MTREDESNHPTLTPSLAPTKVPASAETSQDLSQGLARTTIGELAAAGYQIGELLGRGGMGEVLLAHDQRIGRNVAIKRMRTADPTHDEVDRFLREAKIQARLDHPAIVPVHELGHDAEGRPYFTMKRLAGVTLWDVIDPNGKAPRSIQPLLRAFAEVCLAVEFAHARGVVHRDLKPSNIMLGDFGEVYVLDWGVARVIGEHDELPRGDVALASGETEAGALLGTPGYMPPEQVRGEPVGPHADVYALGAILFEILAGAPLHPRNTNSAIASTLNEPTASPGQRHPDRAVVPELDAACVAALASDPGNRPTARQLADRVQRYLDGDRDTERRRTLATEQLTAARAALDAIPQRRASAMRAAARALALDPASTDAAELVSSLMLEPPADPPPELLTRFADSDRQLFREQGMFSSIAILSYFLVLPMMIWMGVTNWWIVIAAYSMVLAISFITWRAARAKEPQINLAILCNIVLMMILTRMVGPFIIVPGLIGAVTVALLSFPPLLERYVIIIFAMVAGLGVPLVLEGTGVISSTWSIERGSIVTSPTALHIEGTSASVFLIVSNLVMIIVLGLFARSLAMSRRDAHRRVETQAWHLGQLLPRKART